MAAFGSIGMKTFLRRSAALLLVPCFALSGVEGLAGQNAGFALRIARCALSDSSNASDASGDLDARQNARRCAGRWLSHRCAKA